MPGTADGDVMSERAGVRSGGVGQHELVGQVVVVGGVRWLITNAAAAASGRVVVAANSSYVRRCQVAAGRFFGCGPLGGVENPQLSRRFPPQQES
jgi:hypothetical protein